MKWTELSKKEQGRQRYLRHEGRVSAQRASARRTRPSDIAAPRLTDGMKVVHIPQNIQMAVKGNRALPLDFLQKVFASISPEAWSKDK